MQREFHDVANIFPMMQGEEFDALKADIAAHGLREAIWLHPDGRIIDGRNRYLACCELGMEPECRTWDGAGSLVAFVVSLNLHRRHLTESQRAMIAAKLATMGEGRPEKTASIEAVFSGRPSPIVASFAAIMARWLSVKCRRCKFKDTTKATSEPAPSHVRHSGSIPNSQQAK